MFRVRPLAGEKCATSTGAASNYVAVATTAMMYRPIGIQLTHGLFQLSTFRGAGNVYSKLQATKKLYKQHN